MNGGDPEPDRKPDAVEEPSEDARARVSEMEPDSGVCSGAIDEGGDFGEEMEAKESEVKVETPSSEDEEDDEEEDEEDAAGEADVKSAGSQFNSLLSEFDDFVANEKSGQMAASRALRYGFEPGDMVWGKVKSHPWWPGHVYNDALATPQVRRTRREGHVLVAFFGDSSYGWFDPADFIPFDTNFSEKSRQTSSRNFVRALDEAVDEACRRRGLGLVCKCRSRYSFRPADVPGYFLVDVPDYEPNGIYSAKQIQKSRDSFKPREALGFIKNLAMSPCSSDDRDLEFAKNRATVVAYRKAVFEEFDVTYAQAFGVQPGRPTRDRTDSEDPKAKQPPRAPLSGPLVIAETLGSGKSNTKPKKVKDGSKKDKYLLKRRDESDNSKKPQKISQGKASLSSPLASTDGSESRKPPNTTLKPEIVSTTETDSSSNGRETIIADQELVRNSLVAHEEVKEESRSVSKASDPSHVKLESLKTEEFQQLHSVSTDQVQDSIEMNLQTSKVKGVKKTKVKRQREEPDSEAITTEGKKKKKKKQEPGTETGSSDLPKPLVLKKKVVKKVGKKATTASDSLETLPMGEAGSATELDFPRLLTDLQVLALDPCHGMERSSPAIVRRFFLRFRALVYQKSLVSPPPESEIIPTSELPVRDSPSLKPAKPSFRSEDPTIAGRKRPPSDRQEEITTKRSKKVAEIKTLASEKKSNQSTQNQKAPEPYRSGEGRETAVPLGRKTRPDSLKKPAEPTMLVMKFPPKTSLPSPAELKARFARFGPMDQSGLRVFWKSSTCRVVFLHKFDAQAACKFASANSSLFGSPGMRCFIKDAAADTNEPTTAASAAGDSTTTTTASGSSAGVSVSQRPTSAAAGAVSAAQLKSCLKKTSPEDAGLLGPGPRGTPRVKFVLAGEESSRVETGLAGNRNNNISASFGGGGGGGGVTSTSTTSVSKMDFSVQKVNIPLPIPTPIPSSSLPILPLPTHFANNSQQNNNNSSTAKNGAPPISDKVDISQQMLNLLTRCNDVVASVTGLLGYVPFHPL